MEGGMDMNFNESVVDAANLTAVVTSLTPYTNYTIKMAASTSVGLGEFGPVMTVQTNESSKPGHNQLAYLAIGSNKNEFLALHKFCITFVLSRSLVSVVLKVTNHFILLLSQLHTNLRTLQL